MKKIKMLCHECGERFSMTEKQYEEQDHRCPRCECLRTDRAEYGFPPLSESEKVFLGEMTWEQTKAARVRDEYCAHILDGALGTILCDPEKKDSGWLDGFKEYVAQVRVTRHQLAEVRVSESGIFFNGGNIALGPVHTWRESLIRSFYNATR